VVYKLWEGSWEDEAGVRDRAKRIFADPSRIHRIRHDGRHYQLDAIHLCEPSPQRTPVLYQAGASTRGRQFAAAHAECVFIYGPTKEAAKAIVNDIRARAVAEGRAASDITIFLGQSVVVGRTAKEAQEKYEEYHRHASVEGALAHFSSSTGVDFSRFDLDEPIGYEKNDANNSALEAITKRAKEPWTVRKLMSQMGLGARNRALVGSAEAIADQLIGWVEETGVDGFNLSRIVTPESLEDFVELVVPILQERGVYKQDYRPGTLREKLSGRSRLPTTHRAARYRHCRPG
jgi:FMN-dependent oxidoreductase (nitrilotriacetate monooxygenase family)